MDRKGCRDGGVGWIGRVSADCGTNNEIQIEWSCMKKFRWMKIEIVK